MKLRTVAVGLVLSSRLLLPAEARAQSKLTLGAAAVGAVAGAALLDSPLRRPAGKLDYAGPPGVFAGAGSAFDRLGRPETAFALAGLSYAGGWLSGNASAKRVGVVGGSALALTGLATWGLKSAAGRGRPFLGEGPGAWKGLGGGGNGSFSSFPSGHTSMAFTLAAVAADELPLGGDIAVYGLAAAVGAARIHQDQHWATDVLAGAALGWAIGKGVSRWERRSRWSGRLVYSGRGLYFTKRF